jgi:hypothetical protein
VTRRLEGRRRIVLKIVMRGRAFAVDLSYLGENWGAPFIVAFMAMLTICACLLARGDEPAANALAVYAYYLLVVGVVLQLMCYIKYGGEG